MWSMMHVAPALPRDRSQRKRASWSAPFILAWVIVLALTIAYPMAWRLMFPGDEDFGDAFWGLFGVWVVIPQTAVSAVVLCVSLALRSLRVLALGTAAVLFVPVLALAIMILFL